MRCLLLTLLFLPGLCFAHNPTDETFLGWIPDQAGASNTYANFTLSAVDGGDADACSDSLIGYAMYPAASKTVDEVHIFQASKTGTIGATDLTISLHASAAGLPTGAAVNTYDTLVSASTGAMWLEWDGPNDAVTRSTQYYWVLKNCNASPGSNNIVLSRGNVNGGTGRSIDPSRGTAWGNNCSIDGGTAWAQCQAATAAPFWVKYTDTTVAGWGMQGVVNADSTVTGSRTHGTNQQCAEFTIPANVKPNAIGIVATIAKIGTPTGSFRYVLYQGNTRTAYTDSATVSNISASNGKVELYFSADQTIPGGTEVELCLGETSQSDSSSNAFGLTIGTWDSDADAAALRPIGGTFHGTRYTGGTYSGNDLNGGTFADTATEVPAMALILDNGGYYGAVAGGIKNHNQVAGGAQ